MPGVALELRDALDVHDRLGDAPLTRAPGRRPPPRLRAGLSERRAVGRCESEDRRRLLDDLVLTHAEERRVRRPQPVGCTKTSRPSVPVKRRMSSLRPSTRSMRLNGSTGFGSVGPKWAILDSNQGPPPYQSGALTD
jgi:hypothetical protein